MGMPIVVDVRDEGVGGDALEPMFDWLRLVDERFSTYKHGSEISRLGRRELTLEESCEDVREVLAPCDELRVETHGYFDARAGGSLDPSGLVKGWAIDRAATLLGAKLVDLTRVLRLLAAGSSNRDIAVRLKIKYTTVRGYVRSVIEKLDAHSELEAVARAHGYGLVDDEAT